MRRVALHRLRRAGACALAALGTLTAWSARAADWATPGLDATHTRRSAERSGARFDDGRWAFMPEGGAPSLASPVVSDGFLVSAALDGTVSALEAESGRIVWRAVLGSAVQGTPAAASGRVFVPTAGNTIVALGLATGAPLWTVDLGGMNLSSPTPLDADIVVSAGFPRRQVVRLAAATGQVIWRSPEIMGQFSNTSPAIDGGLVVVGTNGGHYYAFDAATGAARWDYQADGMVHLAAPLIAGGRVYLAGGDASDRVHAVDAATGEPVAGWPVSLPTPDPDLPGTRLDRHRAVSSFAAVARLVVLETRLDDALDTDGDGIADRFLSREIVVALDPKSGSLVWQHPLARAVLTDPNQVPKFFICPTPAAFGGRRGGPLLATASSLLPAVSVLDAATGNAAGVLAVAGRALASPVMANGRLFTVAENGSVEAQLSSVNHPPAAPRPWPITHPIDAADVTLRWLPSIDPDGDLASYEVRIDSDGEVLQTFQQRLVTGWGVTSLPVAAPLAPGVVHTFAIRARDPSGALSAWSAPETFEVTAGGAVTLDGVPAPGLRAAVAAAQAGSVVALGAGTYALSAPLQVGPGVRVQGAGAGRTILDGAGLGVGVSFVAADPSHAAGLDGLTVSGADTCVSVGGSATGVLLTHLVARSCSTAGISVDASAAATVVNGTLTDNGTGVRSAGRATVKNSLLTGNGVGLEALSPGALTSTFDDLFANQVDYRGTTGGAGDFSAAVTFGGPASGNFIIAGTQPSTDRGDPADDVGSEPAPNGGRINLGAFGGTADAETSPAPALGADGAGTPPAATTPAAAGEAGSGCRVSGEPSPSGAGVLAVALLCCLSRRRSRRGSARAAASRPPGRCPR